MALPELLRLSVEKKLADYGRNKVPPHLVDKIRIGYRFRGKSVTLFEARPQFFDPSQWSEIVVVQFRYDPATALWTLYCADRNSRWHLYSEINPAKKFEKLLKEVDDDPTGIFWG